QVKAAGIAVLLRTRPWAGLADPVRTAAALNLRALPRSMRTGRWCWIPKGAGDHRLVCSLSWPLRVAQLLLKDVLQVANDPGHHIGDWPGRGPAYHLDALVPQLRHGGVVLLADVRRCFESVQP